MAAKVGRGEAPAENLGQASKDATIWPDAAPPQRHVQSRVDESLHLGLACTHAPGSCRLAGRRAEFSQPGCEAESGLVETAPKAEAPTSNRSMSRAKDKRRWESGPATDSTRFRPALETGSLQLGTGSYFLLRPARRQRSGTESNR